jgi:signal transduction histidine kinase/integral membrane sensor domain MASE1
VRWPDQASWWWALCTAGLVGLGYYLGVLIGSALRFPPATTSVLWPPNSILTAALLLTPPSRWWVCLAGALPVHLYVQTSLGWPLAMVGALFLTNCSEALIGAGLTHVCSDAPSRFDTLRRAGAFVAGAGLAGPILSGFGDAAVVEAFRGEPYWNVWQTRVFSNVLTELSVVPLIVLTVTAGTSCLGRLTRAQFAEALVLGVFLVGVGIFVLAPEAAGFSVPGEAMPMVSVLPLLFWTAIRFGAGGISSALFLLALIASSAAIFGSRPFEGLAPSESLIALQVRLVLMSIPLFAVAALLDERHGAGAELASRLRFEELLARTSASFVRARGTEEAETAFDDGLMRLGMLLDVDLVLFLKVGAGGRELDGTRQWRSDSSPRFDVSRSGQVPWILSRLREGRPIICEDVSTLPDEANGDRVALAGLGLRSVLVVPLVAGSRLHGGLLLATVAARDWSPQTVGQVQLVSELLANEVGRRRSEDELRSSEAMKTAILSSLPSLVAVLDRTGRIIAVNQGWLDVARGDGDSRGAVGVSAVGANYLAVCRRAAAAGDSGASVALGGLEDVLSARADGFATEYSSTDPITRWYAMTVVPLRRSEGGAVVSHVEVTERKRAEVDAQRARQELTHFARVSAMGELTASLAHQLNQPLTGISINAQAARRCLDATPPAVAEVRDIVIDIIDDSLRAGEVIRNMRGMMVRTSGESSVLDVTALIRDVATLVASDTIIRNVSVTFDLDSRVPRVRGHRVELQQVMLNLLVNAIEAVADVPPAERGVIVRSGRGSSGSVLVSVQDSGPGLSPDAEGTIFEPFFTTKTGGMGMGLAIARSIVESHGGRIWAENHSQRGATFCVSLPGADEATM